MANTQKIKTHIEPFVRDWLSRKFHKKFESGEVSLRLAPGGSHKFDAVSVDRKIVAGIRSSVARKNTWQEGGKIKATYTEIHFLNLIRAPNRLLIFTDKVFMDKFMARSVGHYPKSIKLIYCPLPKNLSRVVGRVHRGSSSEIGKRH